MIIEQVLSDTQPTLDVDSVDVTLIHECLAGHERAWEQLFQRYNRLIYKVPSSFGFSQLECEEIYQEIAIEIIRCLHTLQDHTRLHPWIVTIARRICIRHLRTVAKYSTVDVQLLANEIESDVDTLEDLLIRLEEYRLIRQVLAELEPKCRALLTELFLSEQGQSHGEVATRLNMPIGSIGPTRSRCLEKLRQRVEALLDD